MRFLFSSFVITGVLGAIAACGSSSSSNGSPSAGGSSTTETPEAGSNADADGGASAGSDPGTPGDPVPSGGSSAAIQVVINGQLRAFDGEAGWSKSYPDGGVQNGFQTNARDGNHWTILLAVFGDQPGTYDCGHGGGLGIFRDLPLPDGGFDPDRIEYGGTVTTAACTITLTSYGPRKGDHVTGTFSAKLGLSNGFDKTTVKTLQLDNGKFDLVQFADTPSP